jgi:hypothetical protein
MNPMSYVQAGVRTSNEGPEVTWIGPNPFQKGTCLGFEDGTLVCFPRERDFSVRPITIKVGNEAINGVANVGSSSVAISTRSNVTFIEVITREDAPRAVFNEGAHGVVSTKSGYFVAPRGIQGLLIVKPDRGPQQKMRVTTGMGRQLYFYRTIALHDGSGRETLVFANRQNGVGLSDFKGEQDERGVHTLCFAGLDVVDVCGIVDGSLSAIAISQKAEVLWIRDSSSHADPITMKMVGIEGKVYRVLATSRSLFVLSEKALYVWHGLVEEVFAQRSASVKLQPFAIPIRAIDMSLFDEHIMLVLEENGVAGIPIGDLEAPNFNFPNLDTVRSHDMSRRAQIEDYAPRVEHYNSRQGMVLAGS